MWQILISLKKKINCILLHRYCPTPQKYLKTCIFRKIILPTLTIFGPDGSARRPLPLDAKHRVGRHFVINLFGEKEFGEVEPLAPLSHLAAAGVTHVNNNVTAKGSRSVEMIRFSCGGSSSFIGIGDLDWNNCLWIWILRVLDYFNISMIIFRLVCW